MNEVNSIDKVQYKKADNLEINNARNLFKLVSVVVTMLVLIVFEFLVFVANFFRTPKPDNISGKICLVTGGANGLGRCLALKFAEQGCKVVIVDVVDPEPTVKEILESFDVKCRGFKCDISDHGAMETLKDAIEVSMGPVDILVNNAGLLLAGTLKSFSIDCIEKCVAVNLTSHFTAVKLFLPGMIARKSGKIVAISSMLAKMTIPMSTIYAATKCGVDGFMEALFDDLCLDDNEEFVKLTTVFPYFINTRKELGEMMDEVDDFVPRMTPEFVADKIVEGVLNRKRKIFVSPLKLQIITQHLPDRVIKYLKTSTTKAKEFKQKYYE